MKKIYLIIALMSLGFIAKAQYTFHPMATIGYEYQNSNFAEIGGKVLFLKHDDIAYRLGASAMLGGVNSKFAVIPKLQADILFNGEKGVNLNHSYYFLGGAAVTPYYAAPKVGISLFGIIDFTGGYAFSFNKNGINGKELKGMNFNFTINLPFVLLQDLMKK